MCPTVVGYIIVGKAGQGLEAASHTSSQEQREDACMHACIQLIQAQHLESRTQTQRVMLPTWVGLPSSFDIIKTEAH